MDEREQDIVKTLRSIYTYHGIKADPMDATTRQDMEWLLDRWSHR